MRIIVLSTLALLLFAGAGCGNRKKKKNQPDPNAIEANRYTTERGSTVWVMMADFTEEIKSDPFTIIDVHVDDMNKLHLTVEYGGGCKKHDFKIIGSKAVLKSFPAQRPVMIIHNGHNDECRSIVRDEILVDISDFAYTKEDGSEIILLIDEQRVSFKYQAPNSNMK